MADDKRDPKQEEGAPAESARVMIVEESGVARPYMRGIMLHSLMARGASFDEAYETASNVAVRIRGRGELPRIELAKMVAEVHGHELDQHEPPIPIPLTVQVRHGARTHPFSKGALSQSLLAASLEPDKAFEVARRIELILLQQSRHEITRADLRKLAYKTLFDDFGRRTAERYLVWREFQEPDKPVIILLGGTTGAGKTSLGLAVAQRLGISRVLSTDAIRQIMRLMLSPELMPAIHASSFDAHRRMPERAGEQDPVIDGFLAQTAAVSVGVRAIIDRAIEENASLLLDGVSLVPGLIDLDAYADRAHIFFLIVARLDEEAFRSHFLAREERQKRRGADRYVERLEEILHIQEYLLESAERHDVPIVDNITLEGSGLLVIRHVVETLRKESGIDIASLL
jgi:2-phosphoglycerate kinase